MTEPDRLHFISVQEAADRRGLAESALVLTARGIVSHEVDVDGRWCLLVRADRAASAHAELAAYLRENAPRPPATVLPTAAGVWYGIAGYLLVIWQHPLLEGFGIYGGSARYAGRLAAGLVRDGEWWRTITALTLHADLGHIVANSAFGMLFGLLLGRHIGAGVGWLLVLLAAAVANAINAWLQPEAFASIGASTATFAALGIVAAYTFRHGHIRDAEFKRRVGPLFAALCLLVFTGLGDAESDNDRTDVSAHVLGLLCGGVAGTLAGCSRNLHRIGTRGQLAAGGGAVLIIAIAWLLALH